MRADPPAAPRSLAVWREEGKGGGKLKSEKSEEKKEEKAAVSLRPDLFCRCLARTGRHSLPGPRQSQEEFVLFSNSRGFCPALVGLSLRAFNTPCNMRGDTLILPNMCGAFEGGAEGGAGEGELKRVREPDRNRG